MPPLSSRPVTRTNFDDVDDDNDHEKVEGMCQFDMVASLREAGVSLDEHARVSEECIGSEHPPKGARGPINTRRKQFFT